MTSLMLARLVLALLVVAVLAGGCGAPAHGYQEDAGPCSVEVRVTEPPPSTHRAEIVYNHYLDYDQSVGENWPSDLFADADGVAIFGRGRWLRASLDGDLVAALPYPAHPDGWELGSPPITVTHGADGYGAVFSYYLGRLNAEYDVRFCVVPLQGPAPTASCPVLTRGRNPRRSWATWDGSSYQVHGRLDNTTFYLAGFDAAGSPLGTVTLPTAATGSFAIPAYLGEWLLLLSSRPRGTGSLAGCVSDYLDVMPRSVDLQAMRTWELLPTDYVLETAGLVAASPRRVAMIYDGVCSKPDLYLPVECIKNWTPAPPRARFLTLVGQDGAPVLTTQPLRVYGGIDHRPTWDGSRFVLLVESGGSGVPHEYSVYAFDEDGVMTVINAPVPVFIVSGDTVGKIVAVGDNDYVLVYTAAGNAETWIARFFLMPL